MTAEHVEKTHDTLTLAEEVPIISKHDAVTGRVRVRAVSETFTDMISADLRTDTVEVTRRPIDLVVAVMPQVRTEGDVTIVPIVEEILVVEKRLILKEEVHIRKTTGTETVTRSINLRRQKAVVERFEEEAAPASPNPPS